jgi:hypothetical protein
MIDPFDYPEEEQQMENKTSVRQFPQSNIVLDLERPQFGLLRLTSSKISKPHHCSPPGTLLRWLYRFFRMPITVGSLWRCSDCGSVYRFEHDNWDSATGKFVWNEQWLKENSLQIWVDRGGRV